MVEYRGIIHLAAILFFPLLPSYLIYKILPSKTTVKGPFKGLNINLTGAFGGYFLLVIIAISFIIFAIAPYKPTWEIWHITGKIEAKSIDPVTGKEINQGGDTLIGVIPPRFTVDSEGDFRITVMVEPGHVEGKRLYPLLTFNQTGYDGVVLNLAAHRTLISEKTKEIKVKNIITLSKLKDTVTELKWPR